MRLVQLSVDQTQLCPISSALQPTYEKLLSEVPKYKMITLSVLSDRLRVGYSGCLRG